MYTYIHTYVYILLCFILIFILILIYLWLPWNGQPTGSHLWYPVASRMTQISPDSQPMFPEENHQWLRSYGTLEGTSPVVSHILIYIYMYRVFTLYICVHYVHKYKVWIPYIWVGCRTKVAHGLEPMLIRVCEKTKRSAQPFAVPLVSHVSLSNVWTLYSICSWVPRVLSGLGCKCKLAQTTSTITPQRSEMSFSTNLSCDFLNLKQPDLIPRLQKPDKMDVNFPSKKNGSVLGLDCHTHTNPSFTNQFMDPNEKKH